LFLVLITSEFREENQGIFPVESDLGS